MMKKNNVKYFILLSILFTALLTYKTYYSFNSEEFSRKPAQEVTKRPRVIIFSAEVTPLQFSGGLGHATRDLEQILRSQGYDVYIAMPGYHSVIKGELKDSIEKNNWGPTEVKIKLDKQEKEWLSEAKYEIKRMRHPTTDSKILLFEHIQEIGDINFFDNLEERKNPYYTKHKGYEGKAFGSWAKAASQWIEALKEIDRPDVIVINDWHPALLAPFIKELRESFPNQKWPKIIGAVHNLAYKGIFDSDIFGWLGIKPEYFLNNVGGVNGLNGVEFYGKVSFLKALLSFSDMVYTVSNKYAEEITTSRFGKEFAKIMEQLAKEFKLTGILNIIDYNEWNPEKLPEKYKDIIKYTFSTTDIKNVIKDLNNGKEQRITGKTRGKLDLQRELKLPVDKKIPLITMTSRISDQKGVVYLLGEVEVGEGVIKAMLENLDFQLIVTGDGVGDDKYKDPNVEKLKKLQDQYPNKFRYAGYDDLLEKRYTRYADLFLSAPWFEPCGLNQMFSMRMGTLPIISNVGGPADSVENGVTGFLFDIHYSEKYIHLDNTKKAIYDKVSEAINMFKDSPKEFRKMQLAAMMKDNSMKARAKNFNKLVKYVMKNGPKVISDNIAAGKTVYPIERLLELAGQFWKNPAPLMKDMGLGCNELMESFL